MAHPNDSSAKQNARGAIHIAGLLAALLLIAIVYLAIGAYGASRWMKPRRSTDLSATPAAFNLEFQDVRIPSRDSGIEISG